MSVLQMAKVWQLDLPHNKAFVLLALADHAADDGSSVYPSIKYLSWKTGYSERQVQNILKELRSDKIIEPVAHEKGGRGKAVHYQLHLDRAPQKTPWNEAKEKGDKTAPFIDKGETEGNERVQSESIKGEIATAPEPSLEPSKKSKASAKPDNGAFRELFEGLLSALGKEWGNYTRDQTALSTELAICKNLHSRGYTKADVEGCARWCMTWASVVGMKLVSAQINDWKVSGKPKSKQPIIQTGTTYQDWTHGDPRGRV